MPTAARNAHPNGAARTATGAVAVGIDPPLVVIDVDRARRQYGELRQDFPWVDVLYDVCALAHPALLAAVVDAGGGFSAVHDQALPAVLSVGAGRRVLHAAPVAHPHELRAAYDAGVRHFVVDGARALEAFAGAPDDLRLLLKLRPGSPRGAHDRRPAHRAPGGMTALDALDAARSARGLGIRIAGLSLALPHGSGTAEYVAEIVRGIGAAADIETASGFRLRILDLGDGFPGRSGARGAERAELSRAIRGIVAPATSGVTITAAAGRAVTAGCVAVVDGDERREVEAADASALIDAGAEVVVLDTGASRLRRLALLRGRGATEHRIVRRASRS